MALLSHGSIIVEAGANSGTTHQGWAALRLGRPLFLPEHILKEKFSWPSKMQDYGAIPFPLDNINSCLDQLFPALVAGPDRLQRSNALLPA